MAQAVSLQQKQMRITPMFAALAEDTSRWVGFVCLCSIFFFKKNDRASEDGVGCVAAADADAIHICVFAALAAMGE